jgi:hypothetical protein
VIKVFVVGRCGDKEPTLQDNSTGAAGFAKVGRL